jgi:hypothetical protein
MSVAERLGELDSLFAEFDLDQLPDRKVNTATEVAHTEQTGDLDVLAGVDAKTALKIEALYVVGESEMMLSAIDSILQEATG